MSESASHTFHATHRDSIPQGHGAPARPSFLGQELMRSASPISDLDPPLHPLEAPSRAGGAYRSARAVAAWVHDCAAAGVPLDLAPVRAAVRRLIDVLVAGDRRLVTLACLRPGGDHAERHSANVSVLALECGVRLELNRAALLRLGVAALLHDVGKATLPEHILARSGSFGESERAQLQSHTQRGARYLFSIPALPPEALDSIGVALEHHRAVGEGGYPVAAALGLPGAMARLVAVCDFFDAATAHRSHHPLPFLPRPALERMAAQAGTVFDPVAAHLLIESVGCYPPGTVVHLSDGGDAVALVPGEQDPERPWVLRLPRGPRARDGGELCDLAAGGDSLEVEGVLEPWSVGMDPQRLLRDWARSWDTDD